MRETDGVMLAQHYFHNLILSIIQEEEAKENASFKYVSLDWTGSPGWYFWPKEKQGVYYLKLEDALKNGLELESEFKIYYYPHPDEAVFDSFSLIEQMVRVSDLFSLKGVEFTSSCPLHCHEGESHCCEPFKDLKSGKGIPTVEARGKLSAHLYRLGEMRLSWQGTQLSGCRIDAQEYSRTWAVRDTALPGEDGDVVVLNAGDIDRNVPARELTQFFVKRFLSDLLLSGIIKAGGRLEELIACPLVSEFYT